MDSVNTDVLIIGAGIVGLGTGLSITRRFPGLSLTIVEKESQVGTHQTGHNSGVIHSGLYYKPGSLKAKLCVEGSRLMVEFCREHGIPHEICGKVVVATSEEELPRLEELYRRGQANGVPGLEMIGPERLRDLEPNANGIRALHVRSTGITDYAAVARKYAELIEAAGGRVLTATQVTGICGRQVDTTKGSFTAKLVINCAGLYSDKIAMMSGAEPGVRIIPFRGEYYEIADFRRSLVQGLIYPVPDPTLPFLGVHFTRRIDGSIEAGPNAVLAFRREGYKRTDFSAYEFAWSLDFPGFWRMGMKMWRNGVDEYRRSLSKARFTRSLQKLLPQIGENDLQPGGSGVRAQAVDRTGKLVDDFYFVRNDGFLHVLNVPSPAATASLAIGSEIVDKLALEQVLS